jgi:hypothetical protein
MRGDSGNRRRNIVPVLGLFAVLALIVGLMTAPMASAGGGTATIAKKKFKCKKGFKKVKVKGKRKCKKKPAPVVVPLPGPLVRATLTWDNAFEVDLHAYDSSGNHSGWFGGGVVQGIPNSTHSPDVDGLNGKTESFTDNIFVLGGTANREFTYVACFYDNAQTGSFVGVASNGQSTTIPVNTGADSSIIYQVPGGPAPPVSNPC